MNWLRELPFVNKVWIPALVLISVVIGFALGGGFVSDDPLPVDAPAPVVEEVQEEEPAIYEFDVNAWVDEKAASDGLEENVADYLGQLDGIGEYCDESSGEIAQAIDAAVSNLPSQDGPVYLLALAVIFDNVTITQSDETCVELIANASCRT